MYRILEDTLRGEELRPEPGGLFLLLTLEITFRSANRLYLLLSYHSYGLRKPIEEGFWAPPFITLRVDSDEMDMPRTAGQALDAFDRFEADNQATIARNVSQLGYILSLPTRTLKRLGSFTEFKRSPRRPNEQSHVFRIVRYTVKDIEEAVLRNIADPEQRKGYVFLPLDRLPEVITRRPSPEHEVEHAWFLGKPLASNVSFVVERFRSQLGETEVELRPEHFFYEEPGLLIAFAAARAGGPQGGTALKMCDGALEVDARVFRPTVFYRWLGSLGVTQVQLLGNRFLAAIPERHMGDGGVRAVLLRLLEEYATLVCSLEAENESTPGRAPAGTQLVLHHGRYRYGRIAQALGFSAGFGGDAVEQVLELQGAGEAFVESSAEVPVRFGPEGRMPSLAREHTVVASRTLWDAVEEVGEPFLSPLGELAVGNGPSPAGRIYRYSAGPAEGEPRS